MKTKANTHPHKSTTHQEFYFHLNPHWFHTLFQPEDDILFDMDAADIHGGTVFFRKEPDGWYGEASFLSRADQFCRRIGRQQARNRYFKEGPFPMNEVEGDKPTMENAIDLFKWSMSSKFFTASDEETVPNES